MLEKGETQSLIETVVLLPLNLLVSRLRFVCLLFLHASLLFETVFDEKNFLTHLCQSFCSRTKGHFDVEIRRGTNITFFTIKKLLENRFALEQSNKSDVQSCYSDRSDRVCHFSA